MIFKDAERFLVPAPGAQTRAELVARARETRKLIQQHFDNVWYWNRENASRICAPIDPDPHGTLRKLAEEIDQMLANEPAA